MAEVVLRFVPKKSWLLHDIGWDTIHGVRHSLRVVANSWLLCQRLRLPRPVAEVVLTAASLHDLRRNDDRGDVGHARRAASWFRKHQVEVARTFSITPTRRWVALVGTIIAEHERPTETVVHRTVDETLQSILKTADALDRYRLPKASWWIDDRYLDMLPIVSERRFAYDEVVSSERRFLQGNDSITSVCVTYVHPHAT